MRGTGRGHQYLLNHIRLVHTKQPKPDPRTLIYVNRHRAIVVPYITYLVRTNLT
jgi:hypothetical protein